MLPNRRRPTRDERSARFAWLGHGPRHGLWPVRVDPGRPASEAVVLAAGCGSRLGPIGRDQPKCLLEIGGRRLIDHQLTSLREAGIERVIVVAGFEHRQVEAAVRGRADVIVNPAWTNTNSLVSFLLAAPWVSGNIMVINGDVLCHPTIVSRVARARGSAVAYDSTSGSDPEHMKIVHDRGRLVRMAKEIATDQVAGENLGVLRLDRAVVKAVAEAGAKLVADGCEKAWLAEAIVAVTPRHAIHCLDMANLPWIEIDFPTDLARARGEVWPSIQTRPSSAEARPRVREVRWAGAQRHDRLAIPVLADEASMESIETGPR